MVGMGSCQMFRIQSWLECFLAPLCKVYGKFEYIKDSNDMLIAINEVKTVAVEENWDWNTVTLFTIGVKALYPSIKFEFLKVALMKCFNDCTSWYRNAIDILIDIIIYTLSNQQILWKNEYYILNQWQTFSPFGKHISYFYDVRAIQNG